MTPDPLAAIDAALAGYVEWQGSADAMRERSEPDWDSLTRTPMQIWRDAETQWRLDAYAEMYAGIEERARPLARGVDISGGAVTPTGRWWAQVALVVDDPTDRVWETWEGDLACGPAPVRPVSTEAMVRLIANVAPLREAMERAMVKVAEFAARWNAAMNPPTRPALPPVALKSAHKRGRRR